jgi:hypothetical protein
MWVFSQTSCSLPAWAPARCGCVCACRISYIIFVWVCDGGGDGVRPFTILFSGACRDDRIYNNNNIVHNIILCMVWQKGKKIIIIINRHHLPAGGLAVPTTTNARRYSEKFGDHKTVHYAVHSRIFELFNCTPVSCTILNQ